MIYNKSKLIKKRHNLLRELDKPSDEETKRKIREELKTVDLNIKSNIQNTIGGIKMEENKVEENKVEENKVEENKVEENKVEENKVEENKQQKKIFVPRSGSKKEKAWKLFETSNDLKSIAEQIGVKNTTIKTWYGVFKRNK